MPTKSLTLAKIHDEHQKAKTLTVIMLHGLASDSHTYDSALKYLTEKPALKDVRFVTFDLLGSGKSPNTDDIDYTITSQVEALHASIANLKLKTPILLVGHSMGSLIATHYVKKYGAAGLVLISSPFYQDSDFKNPAFAAGMEMFKEAVALKNDRSLLTKKSFNDAIKYVVMGPKNFQTLTTLKVPTIIIYGALDQFIIPHNLKAAAAANPEYIELIKTEGRHGVSRDKYSELAGILERVIDA
ncbi:alpha/beta hydrolase [Candidatus Saccharibacteria bacterium]|nr:alpha/beta hydrolase [Candidatus Saccharibacteria bacterium]